MSQQGHGTQEALAGGLMPGVVGQWTLFVAGCREVDTINFLEISSEEISGKLKGHLGKLVGQGPGGRLEDRHNLDDATITPSGQIKFVIIVGLTRHTFTGLVNGNSMSGKVTPCNGDGNDDGTWSGTGKGGGTPLG